MFLPRVEEAIAFDDVNGYAESGGETLRGEHFGFGAIKKNTAVFEENDAVDFRR